MRCQNCNGKMIKKKVLKCVDCSEEYSTMDDAKEFIKKKEIEELLKEAEEFIEKGKKLFNL